MAWDQSGIRRSCSLLRNQFLRECSTLNPSRFKTDRWRISDPRFLRPGGVFPQWNCGCGNCGWCAREKFSGQGPASQAQLALSGDGFRLVSWPEHLPISPLKLKTTALRFIPERYAILRFAGVVLRECRILTMLSALLLLREPSNLCVCMPPRSIFLANSAGREQHVWDVETGSSRKLSGLP